MSEPLSALLALAESRLPLGQSTLRMVMLAPEVVAALVRVAMAAKVAYQAGLTHMPNALHDRMPKILGDDLRALDAALHKETSDERAREDGDRMDGRQRS